MWEVRTQFSQCMADRMTENLEWSATQVETEAEANTWWNCAVSSRSSTRRVHTMYNAEGEVVRVQFN